MSTKDALRQRTWTRLTEEKVGRFPFPLQGRIPNFKGAEQAAARLQEVSEWRAARRVKCNPDAPQRPVRHLALKEGKHVFMAVPRLTDEACFIHLDPARLTGNLAKASTIKGAFQLGRQVRPDEMGRIDFIVAGSVAVDRRGGRVGKGGGYSDLEYALARETGLVNEDTPVATTVHPLQVGDEDVPMTDHDVPLDAVITPEEVIRTDRRVPKPEGIRWEALSESQIDAMPPVRRARERVR